MDEQRIVLVTGVSGYWGGRLAQRLLAEPDMHVIGLDAEPPEEEIEGLDFVQADVRNPLLGDLLRSESIDVLCHLAFLDSARQSEAAFDLNVMGTMKVVAAAAESGVRQVVWKSSTMVYGAHPDNSAFLKEDATQRGSRSHASTHYLLEIESFLNGFRRQAPEMSLAVLRFASIVGPGALTPMNQYLRQPVAPMILGFDPLMQLIHEDDAVEALAHAILTGADGAFNVAADPPLPLLRILALASRLPLPVPHPLANRSRLRGLSPLPPSYLRYRWVADTTAMQNQLGFAPQHSADEAIEAMASHRRMERYRPGSEAAAYDEERLRATIERRQKQRASRAGSNGQGAVPAEVEREADNE
jgi:UDP-glucose 4-epimerase